MATAKVAAAQKAEAQDGSVSFDFDGHAYTVKADVFDDLETMLLFEDGKILSCVRACLGPVQWATFTSKKRSVSADLTALSTAMFEAIGTSAGESAG